MPEPTHPPTPLPAPPPPAPFQVRLPGDTGPATWTTPPQAGPPTAPGAVPPLGGTPGGARPGPAQPAGAVARSLTNAAPPRTPPRRRRRHPARRSRIAAVVASSVAFVGLVGCTALGSGATSADSPQQGQVPAAGQQAQNDGSAGRPSFDEDRGFGDDHAFGDDDGGFRRPDGGYGQGTTSNAPSGWGGSSAVPGSGSSTSNAPSTRSQGS